MPIACTNVTSGLRTREVHLSPSLAEPVVLIVEDEPLIRMSAIDFIEDTGFLTLDAATADDALNQLKARGDIVAVFADIDMPGSLDGLELANIVSRDWPSIAIIVASGFRRARLEHLPPDGLFFPKPYDFKSIEAGLRRLIAQKKQI